MQANEVLYVLGQNSWLDWIEPFLTSPSKDVCVVAEEGSLDVAYSSVLRVVNQFTPEGVIFLSHHDTLERDAALSEVLKQEHGIPSVAQPKSVALLAKDKALMSLHAKAVPGLNTIESISIDRASEYLERNPGHSLALKDPAGTEGLGFQVIRSQAEVDKLLPSLAFSSHYLLQPFISGSEYSVNLITDGQRSLLFEPVYKSENSIENWVHPCRRPRYCPSLTTDSSIRKRLLSCSRDYSKEIEAFGLLEIEFIVDDSGEIWFLEVNPRLSATMRMVSVASKRSIFTELTSLLSPTLLDDMVLPTHGFSAEVALSASKKKELEASWTRDSNYWVSSRLTVFEECDQQLASTLSKITGTGAI